MFRLIVSKRINLPAPKGELKVLDDVPFRGEVLHVKGTRAQFDTFVREVCDSNLSCMVERCGWCPVDMEPQRSRVFLVLE